MRTMGPVDWCSCHSESPPWAVLSPCEPNQPFLLEVALGRHFVTAVRKLRHHYPGNTEKQAAVPFLGGGAQSSGGGSQDPDEHSQFQREHANEGVNKTCLPDSMRDRNRSRPPGAQIFGMDLMVYAIPPGYHNHPPKPSRVESFA